MSTIKLEKAPSDMARSLPFEIEGAKAELVEIEAVEALYLPKAQDWRTKRGVQKALKSAKITWPEIGQATTTPFGALAFSGLDQVLHFGQKLPELKGVEVIDVTGGWQVIRLAGEGRNEVMSRLVPVDVRDEKIPVGGVVRTVFGHIPALILKHSDGFDIAVMSSFSQSAAAHLVHIMKKLAAIRKIES